MDELYRDIILHHYKYPQNFGKLSHSTVSASDEVVSCGDAISMELLIKNELVEEIAFQGNGCAISMASVSLLTEYVKNKPIASLKQMTADDMVALLGIQLTPTRLKCALLGLEVLHKALNKIHG